MCTWSSSGTGGRREAGGKTGRKVRPGEEWRPELRRELTNGRIEAGEGEASIGCCSLENIGCQHRVSTWPGHLLPLVFHAPVLKPNLKQNNFNTIKIF